jgi:hypothetical protein
MNLFKKAALLTAISALFASSPLFANETYVCTNGGQERQIHILYTNEGSSVPCEVTYEKSIGTTSLWRAENQAGYCEDMAMAFVEKQRGWGWECNKQM